VSEYKNELAELVRAFFPGVTVKTADNIEKVSYDDLIFKCCHKKIGDNIIETTVEFFNGTETKGKYHERFELDPNLSKLELRRLAKNRSKLLLYQALEEITGRCLEWGCLTGIRPTKIVHGLMDQGFEEEVILNILYDDYRVSSEKARLLIDIAKVQRPYFENNHPNKISVYINIPICSTKCLFCSFPSATIDRCNHLINDYILALEKEMEVMSQLAKEKGIEVESLYIGGGTPTSLNVIQLEKVLSAVDKHWGSQPWKEYTVEGGRPDTMDKEKLRLLKDFNVTRISINPQTMNNKTLELIGRDHRAEEIVHCFHMAREFAFDSINMDVIVGLPGEGTKEARHTIEVIEKLKPDNFTVHTLAVKRASRLKESLDDYKFASPELAVDMMDIFYKGAIAMGMTPYYLYRQKYMLGNMENIGFAIPSKESIYNMQIMEDQQTIWAFGAAAISKFVYPKEGRIERAPNVKNIDEYINRIDEMIERKLKLTF
jgi:coproporphyrinogen dehydrogenase HemZ